MLKKTVTYTDPFDGNEVTEDLYFNLTKAEIAELAMVKGEGYSERLKKLAVTTDGQEIINEFKSLIGMSYGKREGSRHIKSPEITAEFLSSEAYSELFIQLISSPDSGADFFAAILPKDIEKMTEGLPIAKTGNNAANSDEPAWIRENRVPTDAEMKGMTKAQMAEAFRRKLQG